MRKLGTCMTGCSFILESTCQGLFLPLKSTFQSVDWKHFHSPLKVNFTSKSKLYKSIWTPQDQTKKHWTSRLGTKPKQFGHTLNQHWTSNLTKEMFYWHIQSQFDFNWCNSFLFLARCLSESVTAIHWSFICTSKQLHRLSYCSWSTF